MAEVETPVLKSKNEGAEPSTKAEKCTTVALKAQSEVEASPKATKDDAGTSPSKISKDAIEAINLLAQGKRNVMCGEIPQAVQQLQEACRLFASLYGDTADQCGEAYLCYGSALLDLSRMESGVLGNALQGIDSEEDEQASSSDDKIESPEKVSEEEREKISEQVIDAMTEEREAELKARKEKEKKLSQNGDSKENLRPTENGVATEGKTEDKGKTEDGEKENKGDKDEVEKKDNTEDDNVDLKDNGDPKLKEVESDGKEDVDQERNSEKTDSEKTKQQEEMDTEEKKDEDEEGTEGEGTEVESEDICTEDDAAEGEEGAEPEGDKKEGEPGTSSDDKEKKEDEEDEEDVSNLQLAWEILELAKVIYSRHDTKEMKLKCADANLRLGEVGLETEQYEQAIDDFKACLKIQKAYLEPDSRLIAETHYQIGLACCFSGKYDESVENYKKAVEVINNKVAKLEKVIEEAEKAGKGKEVSVFDDPVSKAQKEIKDLKEILPDILGKIEDTEDEKKSQEQVKKIVKESVSVELGASTSGFDQPSSTSPAKEIQPKSVNDISHLVRKKRKPEEESESEANKKAKPEETPAETVNGKKSPEKMESSA